MTNPVIFWSSRVGEELAWHDHIDRDPDASMVVSYDPPLIPGPDGVTLYQGTATPRRGWAFDPFATAGDPTGGGQLTGFTSVSPNFTVGRNPSGQAYTGAATQATAHRPVSARIEGMPPGAEINVYIYFHNGPEGPQTYELFRNGVSAGKSVVAASGVYTKFTPMIVPEDGVLSWELELSATAAGRRFQLYSHWVGTFGAALTRYTLGGDTVDFPEIAWDGEPFRSPVTFRGLWVSSSPSVPTQFDLNGPWSWAVRCYGAPDSDNYHDIGGDQGSYTDIEVYFAPEISSMRAWASHAPVSGQGVGWGNPILAGPFPRWVDILATFDGTTFAMTVDDDAPLTSPVSGVPATSPLLDFVDYSSSNRREYNPAIVAAMGGANAHSLGPSTAGFMIFDRILTPAEWAILRADPNWSIDSLSDTADPGGHARPIGVAQAGVATSPGVS